MAKLKLNVNGAGIKDFFVQHGEKLVMGLAGMALAWFVFLAATGEKLPSNQQPEVLSSQATGAVTKINEANPDLAEYTPTEYQAQVVSQPIEVAAYAISRPWNRPPVPAKAEQQAVEVFNAEKLQAHAASGLWALKRNPPKLASPRSLGGGQPAVSGRAFQLNWVVVTGLVPARKQRAELDAKAPGKLPAYAGFEIERAEVTGNPPQAGPWQPIEYKAVFALQENFDGASDKVDAKFSTDATLAMKLPPRLREEWDDSVAHPPEIPLLRNEAEPKAPAEPAPDVDPLLDDSPPKKTSPLDEASVPGRQSGAELTLFQDGEEEATTPVREETPAEGESESGEATPEFLLLRFYDRTIEPGKSYQYRVKLKVQDPYAAEPAAGASAPRPPAGPLPASRPVAEEKADVATLSAANWSEPTAPVQVAKTLDVLAGPVKPGPDPKATVWVRWFDNKTGLELFAKRELERGESTSFTATDVRAIDWAARQVGKPTDAAQTIEFKSGLVVLDARGGKDLRGRLNPTQQEFGEVYLLDADGVTHVRYEREDLEVTSLLEEERTAEPARPAAGRPRPGNALDELDERPAAPSPRSRRPAAR